MAWLTEIWATDELASVGLSPRRRAIFDGPPGVGKTTLAHHLSARLGLTMVAVHPERIIEKYLGSTSRNIGKLFDLANDDPEDPIVLFFDEFDAIALKRKETDQAAGAEQNAWVNVLLQRIERHPSFIIAATNHSKTIDPAIWRRFDIHISLELPGQEERERILSRYLDPYGLPADPLAHLAEAFATASPALMRQFCEGMKRNIVLGPRLNWDMRKEATVGRLIASVSPHPDLGRPRLWTLGAKDHAVKSLPWPLPRAGEIDLPAPIIERPDNVVALGVRA
jgi:SpoVK/Ycf46/Vps4 family AAA+-type ATPase